MCCQSYRKKVPLYYEIQSQEIIQCHRNYEESTPTEGQENRNKNRTNSYIFFKDFIHLRIENYTLNGSNAVAY